jgi:DNA-binding winged helix-turn-helix (wHTH) protein/dipeptidyl aminopeptidase/acylaminoacyl peptidase
MTRNGDGSAATHETGPDGPSGYAFAGFRLDLRRLGVSRGDEPVALEPKAFDVLRYLIERRDRLVPKDELLDAIWKDTFVTPNALTRAVAQLRKVLGDDAEHPRLVETVPKRGYRFIGEVTETSGGKALASGGSALASDGSALPSDGKAFPSDGRALAPDAPASRRLWLVAAVLLIAGVSATLWFTRARPADAPAPQVSISPVTSSGDVIDAVISRDGRYVAYVRSAFGNQGLWLRQLGGANPIQLISDAVVSYYGLAFAHDSASIYYVVRGAEPLATPGGMLFQIPTLGGTPRRLGAVFDHQPAVSPDGRLLASLRASFDTPGRSALVVANADGSGLRSVFTPEPPEFVAPGFFVAPSWSPSGEEISLAIRDTASVAARLATVNLATGVVRRFDPTFADATATAWIPDGSGIAFIAADSVAKRSTELGAQLWIQPLPSGPPRAITAGPVTYRNVSFSADSTKLVTVGSNHRGALWTFPLAGGPARKLPSLRQDGIAGVAWLGADALVFTSMDSGSSQIWTSRADGSERRQITSDGWNFWPTPTKDGQRIYFVSARGREFGVWRMNRDGAEPRFIAPLRNPYGMALTPDERTLLYTATSGGRDSTWKISVDGGAPVLVVEGLTRARVSPDGRMVAGIFEPGPNESPVIAVFPIDGGPALKTFAGNFIADGPGAVWWTGAGDAILTTTAERANLWRLPLRGGAPVKVTDFADGVIVTCSLSPDARTVVAFRGDQFRDAFVVTGF